jgi:hypothetical protein
MAAHLIVFSPYSWYGAASYFPEPRRSFRRAGNSLPPHTNAARLAYLTASCRTKTRFARRQKSNQNSKHSCSHFANSSKQNGPFPPSTRRHPTTAPPDRSTAQVETPLFPE